MFGHLPHGTWLRAILNVRSISEVIEIFRFKKCCPFLGWHLRSWHFSYRIQECCNRINTNILGLTVIIILRDVFSIGQLIITIILSVNSLKKAGLKLFSPKMAAIVNMTNLSKNSCFSTLNLAQRVLEAVMLEDRGLQTTSRCVFFQPVWISCRQTLVIELKCFDP